MSAEQWLRERERERTVASAAEFTAQRAYVEDNAKTVAALCSRRAGKSYGNALRLLRAAELHPGELSLYVAQTKNNARMICGRALQESARARGIRVTMREVDQRLHAVLSNGHHVWLAGARHREAFEDFRGYAFAEAIVDEAQFYGAYLQEVVEEILEPALGDLDGALCLTGTPSPLPVGFFHAVTTGLDVSLEDGAPIPRWSTHTWTVAENRYFRAGQGAAWLEDIRRRRGWSEQHPTYRREYCGEWVHDPGALVYQVSAESNLYDERPIDGDWSRVLGVDLGYEDSTAWVVCAYRRGHPEVWVEHVEKRQHLIPSAVAAHTQRLRDEHRPSVIVVDAGGLGKGYVEEFKQRYGLPVEAAEKREKIAFVTMLGGDLRSGVVKIHRTRCRGLLEELQALQWTDDRTAIDERTEDHAADALLYAWRACRTRYRPELDGPAPGTPEALEAEARAEKARVAAEIQKRARKAWAKQHRLASGQRWRS